MDKKEKYSIRKIKGIVGSVLLMSIFVPMNIASASDYHYVDKETLSNSEKSQIKEGTPDSKVGSYVLVYEKNILPNTKAINNYILTIFGLLSVGSLLFVVNNKKKTVSLLLVTTLGLTNLSSTMAVDLSKTIRESGTEGVVNILGYRYIGYIELDKTKEKEIENSIENTKDNSLVQPEKTEKIISEKEKSLVTPEKTAEVVSEKGEPLIQSEKPTAVVSEKGESLVQPEKPTGVVSEKGEPLVQSENPIGVVSEKGEPLVQPEKPTGVVSEKGEPLVQPEKPTGVVSEKGEPLVQSENPIGVVSEKGEPLVQPEKPTGVVSEKGESLVQPENPVGIVSKKGESLIQPENPIGVVSEKGESLVQPENPIGVVSEKGESLVQPENPIGVVSEKGEPLVQPEKPTGVVSEKGESLVQPENPVGIVSEKGESLIQPENPIGVVSEKGESLVQPENPIGVVSEKGEPLIQPENPEAVVEKENPELSLVDIVEKPTEKEIKLNYNLINKDNVEIKKIKVEILDGIEVVKEVNLNTDKLTDSISGLKLYKDYKIRTSLTYNKGEEDKTITLEEKPFKLELKKVEIKDVKSTQLIKVNENKEEVDDTNFTTIPTDKSNYYLKITTNDNKTNKLAVKSITEETVNGENFYKITAEATDLIQHSKEEQINNEYTYYIAKPKQKENNVYYDFGELVKAIQDNPEGDYKIGQSLNATNIKPNGKSYITKRFKGTLTSTDGNKFAIHNLSNPLFDVMENATIKDLIFSNVNINKPNIEQIATLGKDAINTTIENIKITGSIVGSNDVAGVVNNLKDRSRMKNVAVIGKLHTEGKKGWSISGLVNNQNKANIEKVYTDVEITGEKARGSALVSTLDRGADPMDVRANGHIKKAVAKGSINLKNNVDTGGVISKNWPYGYLEDVISYVKVNNAEKLYGSGDIGDDDFGYPYLNRVVSVAGEATGNVTRKNANKLREISKEEADRKLEEFDITAKDFEAPTLLVDKLNNNISKDDEYKTTQDYDKTREQAYRNIAKLQPFYNKEWIVNQGNKLTNENLLNKKVISVIGMRDNEFITDLSEANKILVHYSDKTKDIFTVSPKESKVSQIKEYSINELKDIVYTPNMIEKDRTSIESKIKEKLNSVELQSDGIYNLMDKRNNPQENTTERRKGYVRDLFLEESFEEVKNNLDSLANKLLLNYDFQLNDTKASEEVLLQKVENNKEKIMLGLAYLNRYYGINFDNMNIKEIMLFKPDFYGKNIDVLDFLIKIGSSERNVKGDRTLEAYRENIGGTLGIDELNGFLHYNMNLLTGFTDINDWFKDATKKNLYIAEPETSFEDFKNKKHRAYDGLNNDVHSRMILPLLNLKKAHIFLISTYNTMAYSAFEKYGKNTEEARNEFKKEIDKVAKAQQNYLDFWARLSSDKVRNQLLKSQNVVPSPVWDNMNAQGYGWLDKYGHKNGSPDYAPSRELFGPTGRYYPPNWNMGAMAKIWTDPYKEDSVYYMITDMISDFGISAFTHETTHINDKMVYLGGWRHREGTFVEAFAQGMLQSPSVSNPNGEYGALGLNMAYERENDGKQWYNYNPNKLRNRQEIDNYMKRYNEAMMLLDYVEAEAVLSKNLTDNSQWFKKVDRKMREKGSYNNNLVAPNQWDLVRDLNDNEKAIKLNTIADLVNNNFATKHGVGNGVFKPEDFTPNSSYVTVNMMAGIYGGNTSDGAVGALSFKHNTFRMWGYFGYLDGFLGYASNKYKDTANRENKGLLSDKLIIQKVSGGRFNTLEEWKNTWYQEVYNKATSKGFVSITVDNEQISTYERLKKLFNEAVQKDLDELSDNKVKNKYRNTVSLKEKVFKQLLKESDGFSNEFFK